MLERKDNGLSPAELFKLHIGPDSKKNNIPLYRISAVFEAHTNDADYQLRIAQGSIIRTLKEGTALPDDILAVMTNPEAQDEIRIWCKGKNIRLREDVVEDAEGKYRRAKKLLASDEDLIEKLSPHLKQIDLARILVLKKYREADEDTQQSLVSGTYRLLGDVLGPRRYYKYEGQIVTPINLPDLPIELFDDEVIKNVLLESEKEAVLPIFQKSVAEGYKYLEDRKRALTEPTLIGFTDEIEEYYREGLSLSVPGLQDKIAGSFKDLPDQSEITYSEFPAVHQKLYGYRLKHKQIGPVDLLIGDVRTGKTKGAIYGLAAVGAKSTVVVCPPSLRDNWEREIRETYEDPVEVIKVESERELRNLAKKKLAEPKDTKRFVILGYSLLSRLNVLESPQLFRDFVNNLGLDSLDADEVHLAKEADAECTRQLYLLSRALPKEAPRIAMTATGVVNTVEDLDAPVRILLPYEYVNPGDFTRSARNDPHLVSALLYGKRLMTRWTAEAILGDRLPPVEYRTEPVPFSPFHKSVYEFVYFDHTIDSPVKRGMLRQTSLDPLLIRRHYHPDSLIKMIDDLKQKRVAEQDERKQEIIDERIKAFEERMQLVANLSSFGEAMRNLAEAHDKFIQWQLTQQETVFNEDFLVKIGYEKLALWTFFNLPGGMDELIKASQNKLLEQDWEGLGTDGLYSSKYRRLKELIAEKMAAGKSRIAIYSGFYTTGVTSGIEDISEGDRLAFFSLYDHLRDWYGEEICSKIDGSVALEPKKGELAAREMVRRRWRLDPINRLILLSNRAARLGIDLTIPSTKENARFTEVAIYHLDQPDTAADKIQGDGRFRGPGQIIKDVVTDMQATNAEQPDSVRYGFIDHGMWQALEFKRLISQMTLDAVPLTEEEESFVKSNLTNLKIELYPMTPQAYLTQRFFVDIRGQGTKKNLEYLVKAGFESLTNAEFFVTYYAQNDEMSLAGHNAKAVSEMIKRHKEALGRERFLIGSVGAGAGVLQAALGEEIVNIDMFSDILSFAQYRLGNTGSFIAADGASLPMKSEVFDILDASLVTHWTSNEPIRTQDNNVSSERAKFIQELNRATKMDGRLTLTLPSSYLTEDQFKRWMSCLSGYFGFAPVEDVPSGLLKATDYRSEAISWVFNLRKVGQPQTGFSLHDLRLDFEEIVHIISGRNHNGNGGIRIPQPIPHAEFEIVDPNGKTEELSYSAPTFKVDILDIEKELMGEIEKMPASGEELLSMFGVEEYGLYRRLRRIAKNRWNLQMSEADRLALEAVTNWAKSNNQRHNFGQILTELDIIMENLYGRKKSNGS